LVFAPFGVLTVAFLVWFLFGGLFIEGPDPVLLKRLAELEELRNKAKEGDPRVQYRMGVTLRDGRLGEKDFVKAAEWFKKSAKKGYAKSQYALARLYEVGAGVRQDSEQAVKWYRLAAIFGKHPEAEYALADLYFNGRGLGQDYINALDWYRRAALRGHAGALFTMGSMYEKGWGGERDLVEAYAWYSLANQVPDKVGQYISGAEPAGDLARISESLTRADLMVAKRRHKTLERHLAKSTKR